ncbi:MAG: hypothetical protein A3G52_00860 [Candidatus Taylorbacteria bacterium RIFCSPLOWO2_12_FULL_43_20]|uniref:ATP synthase subunit b n=1 Tax=Candidatus Taylorbacteria bacterium RIFCSPLOWO2_12_FULL_43_20 TaxID=1802332 RepID=A0A1G2NZF9_9BACT|nr:MAG: hypothetical protein A2825_03305 [Candidatus Taylorbacteria bacterium RIFCSPHIGHO2_01_FULL_43_120]OHA23708.1 MAG: hypothetical protein A3B98_00710 [Candidatus Taylorbacteria bacterium RIFCSPHIGHO2_02_FULL_43_55]OHA27961.1 MAG: hypothetical protein A3E92_03025 [Candidatus Taylorbacteria bacterium RIFCSPHIGHO2_12_FULL_42_34]OHA32056.1 MAG: hypothetical protein A3B09_02905 [Candidatus Taylorbacteria bacterium RIFCSPLOWO2_01_FULL_43_83]OHA39806.1 MAG: hypothetical protein A3H58_03680 [Candi
MESIISTFHIDWKIIVAQAINFAIVFGVLYFLALKPLQKLMEERSERIARGVDDAKRNAALLESSEKEYQEALTKARAEAQAIFQEGKNEAETKRAEILEKTHLEVEVMIANGKKTLEDEKVKIVEEAKNEIATLAIEATKKILIADADQIEKIK